MYKRNMYKAIVSIAIALAFITPVTVFANIGRMPPHDFSHSYSTSDDLLVDYGVKVAERLDHDIDEILLYAWGPIERGQEILSVKKHILTAPEKGHVIYIDLYPQANLFHPVQYVFLSESTSEFIVIDAISPPRNFDDYQMIETAFGMLFKSVENRRAAISEGKIHSFMQDSTRIMWAVIMNGGASSGSNHVRYWNDLSNIYITLNHVYGFSDENIIVLCSDGLDPSPDQSNGLNSDPDLDGDGDDDIMYSCNLSNVDMVFADLANILTENDKLFIFTTDHGGSNGGWDVFQNLWNHEELTDAHFAELLEALPNCEIICTFEPCYSGGFLDDAVVPPGPVIASSACRHDEFSWATHNLEYDEYVFHWTAAIKGEDAYGNPVDADYNQDGMITMDEAYTYAEEHDARDEHPQYGDYPENIGSQIFLYPSFPPEDPLKPSGPSEALILEEHSFSTSTNDPEGEKVFYQWDWGDGTVSDWIGPYDSGANAQAKHSWTEEGDYNITVKAKDVSGMKSGWSDPTPIHIINVPILEIGNITGGIGKVSTILKNTGSLDAISVDWSIILDGGFILLGKKTTGKAIIIPAGENVNVRSKPILGFGNTVVTVTADKPGVSSDTKEKKAFVLLFFIKMKI